MEMVLCQIFIEKLAKMILYQCVIPIQFDSFSNILGVRGKLSMIFDLSDVTASNYVF